MKIPADKSTFAVYIGNRGFFPASLLTAAREEMASVLKKLGHNALFMDASLTRHGAVETPAEGERFAAFLKENADKIDGVILTLPNFGDENGAVAALKGAGLPIFVHAYPDDMDKMSPQLRRDAFCGKLSIMDVFYQNNIKFTALKPHTVSPQSAKFAESIAHFDSVCRTVKAMKNMVVGSIGARTSAFKTVRIDELALQRNRVTMETFDMSDVFARVRSMQDSDAPVVEKMGVLKSYTNFSGVPQESFYNLAKVGVVLDTLVDECKLDAIAVRCWLEIQQQLGISPCVLLSEMNNRGVIASCEVDVGNAVAMYALSSASGNVSTCLDWNNNYGDDENKCILFHCGPVPKSMMTGDGLVTTHCILDNAPGITSSYGCNTGRIKPTPFTFSSMMTDCGRLKFYIGEGSITSDPIPDNYFGCAGVSEIPDLQEVLLHIGRQGHRHHVGLTPGNYAQAAREAMEYYLGYDVTMPQQLQ